MNEGTREKEQVIDPRMDEIIPQTVLFFFLPGDIFLTDFLYIK